MVRRAALLFAGLALLHTWPLASAPAGASLNYNSDAELNAWILSWVARTLPADPARLFDGNIFAPERGTLAYSEPLVVPALIGAPVRWLGGSAVLTFNLVLLAGLTLTALSGWWVAWKWTGSNGAALLAGALLAFNEHLLTRLPHTAASHLWGLPLALYFADRLVERPNRRDGVLLALVVAAVAATSVYTLAFAGLIVAVVLASGFVAGRWRGPAALAVSAIGGLALAAPVLVPYVRFAAAGATRPIELVAQFAAAPSAYVTSMSRLHAGWSAPFFRDEVNVFFAGFVALVLAAIGLGAAVRDPARRRRALVLASIAAVGVALSFGPNTPFYAWLYDHVPPLRGIRAPARFGYLYLMAVALLAGFGMAWLLARMRTSRWVPVAAAATLALVTAETVRAPIRTEPFAGVPPIYSLLADVDGPVLLVEVPFWTPDVMHENGEYVLNATAHWRPVMNGYSGFTPMSYRERSGLFWYFPREGTVEAMRREGATHVMVHLERFDDRERREVAGNLAGRRDLWLIATDTAGHRLYELRQRR
jgi:hypothetical protein